MDAEKLMQGIFNEVNAALRAMEKARKPEEKRQSSEIVKNHCESLGVSLRLIADTADFDDEDKAVPF